MTEFDPDAADAFDALGQEDRIGILEALVEKRVETPTEAGLSFSELRERTGVTDSGRFNYHLGKLTGRFVQETDEGYELNAAGQEVVGAILSGSFDAEPCWGPADMEAPCHECGEPVAVTYEGGMIAVECEEGHPNHRDYFPASIVERMSLPDAMCLATLMGQQDVDLLVRDVCPNCYGEAASGIVLEDGNPLLEGQCNHCGHFLQGPPSLAVVTHPVTQAFYLERGRDLREASLWSVPFLIEPERVDLESEDPIRVSVDASYEGDDLTFLLDEDCSVVEYSADRISGSG